VIVALTWFLTLKTSKPPQTDKPPTGK